MARLSSHWIPGPFRTNSLYLVAALVVFGAVVFVLFRGRSGVPQEASAGATIPEADSGGNPTQSPAAVSDAQPQPGATASTVAEPQPGSSPPGAAAPVPADSQLNPAVADILSRAVALRQSQPGRIIEARNNLNDALKLTMTTQQRQTVKDEMAKLADDWLFGPAVFAGDTLCETYMVKRGDLLQVIGRRHKIPYEILMQINHIRRPEALQAGRAIKVVKGPFHAKVHRSTYTLDLHLGDMYVRSFKVGLGKPGYETPTGLWRVQENGKLIQPPWTDPDTGRLYTSSDSDYPLGSRWIALDGLEGEAKNRTGFAIHGTKSPEQIGTAGSRGCIRMYNGDAVLMFNLLTPVYSQIEIIE
ncbi:MAG: L,D-transpeptidase family protein [Sedimentisphaerales bacterium]|nr:L,D-transpeptidase family protein [Sedimentisphaerales bacterium]